MTLKNAFRTGSVRWTLSYMFKTRIFTGSEHFLLHACINSEARSIPACANMAEQSLENAKSEFGWYNQISDFHSPSVKEGINIV